MFDLNCDEYSAYGHVDSNSGSTSRGAQIKWMTFQNSNRYAMLGNLRPQADKTSKHHCRVTSLSMTRRLQLLAMDCSASGRMAAQIVRNSTKANFKGFVHTDSVKIDPTQILIETIKLPKIEMAAIVKFCDRVRQAMEGLGAPVSGRMAQTLIFQQVVVDLGREARAAARSRLSKNTAHPREAAKPVKDDVDAALALAMEAEQKAKNADDLAISLKDQNSALVAENSDLKSERDRLRSVLAKIAKAAGNALK
ncbi:MAG: hypothetical protein ISN29_04980 [Gammaproteobacteria bacterium AqS3]|nr:hypothetical protein [Gammaproteobacteria bacterium AqS3]